MASGPTVDRFDLWPENFDWAQGAQIQRWRSLCGAEINALIDAAGAVGLARITARTTAMTLIRRVVRLYTHTYVYMYICVWACRSLCV